jgi:benzoate-CoA ligase family protein
MPVPPRYNLFDDFFDPERLKTIGSRTAIEFQDRVITYDALRAEILGWRLDLVSRGIEKGDRVGLLLYDSPEFIAIFFAIVSMGAVCVPMNTFLPAEDIAFIMSDSGTRFVISEPDISARLEETLTESDGSRVLVVDRQNGGKGGIPWQAMTPAETREDTPAFLLYTSGSTGTPKGVLHLHGSIPWTVDCYSRCVLKLTANDGLYSASRLFFAYGLGNSLSFPLAAGARVILDAERPTAEHLARLLRQRKPTVFFGVPAVYNALLEFDAANSELDLSSLRLCVSAGEALPSRIFDAWLNRWGIPILDGIGSTEMLHIFISNRVEDARGGSSGKIVDGYAARLVDNSGCAVGPGEPGNLWVRGGSATAGYWKRPELTASTIDAGWVRTGDVYREDGEGYFYHIGRSDDCFKVRGLWVSPVEVEEALMQHNDVVEAAVVPSMNCKGLATVKAFIVIRTGRTGHMIEELRHFLASRLQGHKVPTEFECVEQLPRTATGKVQRFKLRGGVR